MHIHGTISGLFSSTMLTLYISRAEDQGQSNLPAAATTTDVGRIDPQSLPSLAVVCLQRPPYDNGRTHIAEG